MPYYLFRIADQDRLGLVRKLDLQAVFDGFRDAGKEAKRLRRECAEEGVLYKVMFAESQLAAEELLLEKRERPVLMEHER